jgi:hypothetical protein
MTAQRSTTTTTAAAASGSSSAAAAAAAAAHIQPLRGLVVHIEPANFTNEAACMQWAAIARAAGATVVSALEHDEPEQQHDGSSSDSDDVDAAASAAEQQHMVLCDNSLLGTAAAAASAAASAAAAAASSSAAAATAAGRSGSANKSKGKAKAKRTAAVVQYKRAPTDWAVQCILQGAQVPVPTHEAPLLASVSTAEKRYTVGDYVQYTDKHGEVSCYGQITSFNKSKKCAVLTPLQLTQPSSRYLQRIAAQTVAVPLDTVQQQLLVLPASMYKKVAYKGGYAFPLVYSLLDDSSSSSSSASSCSGSAV